MAYTPDYTETDLSASIIDVIVKAIIVVGIFITIIMLAFIWRMVTRLAKR